MSEEKIVFGDLDISSLIDPDISAEMRTLANGDEGIATGLLLIQVLRKLSTFVIIQTGSSAACGHYYEDVKELAIDRETDTCTICGAKL